MMKITLYILSLSLFILLNSCGTTKTDTAVGGPEIMWNEMETFSDTTAIDLTKRKVFHAAETIFTDLIHTKLEVSFDWNKSYLLGKATITAKPPFLS